MIVGAGLAGLIAGHVFPRHRIVEKRPEPTAAHQAVLRFRSSIVGELTGIEFRPVTVRKGIWEKERWWPANITSANSYSRKVIGRVIDRSIWNLDPVTRWIAPADFYWQMVEAMKDRIDWGIVAQFDGKEPIINTSPLPIVLDSLGIRHKLTFERSAISVLRFQLPDYFDVYQTVYFPTHTHTLYRASITGNLLICEFAGTVPAGNWKLEVMNSFAIASSEMVEISSMEQEYGKIAPIEDGMRKALLAQLTDQHNIFSLGRFATWRNILLDDVAHDATVVKRLIHLNSYERKLENL